MLAPVKARGHIWAALTGAPPSHVLLRLIASSSDPKRGVLLAPHVGGDIPAEARELGDDGPRRSLRLVEVAIDVRARLHSDPLRPSHARHHRRSLQH